MTAVASMALVAFSGCSLQEVVVPGLSGPSELGLSLLLRAIPDVLNWDGVSQALIVIEARDDQSQPVRNLPLRVEIIFNGERQDFGTLSTRSVVTGSNGRAEVTYRAPNLSNDSDPFFLVTIRVTPVGENYQNANPRTLTIRLVPPGVIRPRNRTPVAKFVYSLPAEEGTPIRFTSSSYDPDPDGQIVSYFWDFGDGTTGSGRVVSKTYTRAADYTVIHAVVDDRGDTNCADPPATCADYVDEEGNPDPDKNPNDGVQIVSVSSTGAPTADIQFSPASPDPEQTVFFTGEGSRAATGRTIVKYEWQLGDGTSATGMRVSHAYDEPGSYLVVLTVTDDVGKQGTDTATVEVEGDVPTADIQFSPTAPARGQRVFFTGEGSTAAPGHKIVRYTWQFGDGASDTGMRVSHRYTAIGTYTVVLTVRDDLGQEATDTATVVVSEATGGVFASFTFSPKDPVVGDTVHFDGSESTSPRTITKYDWNFGDGSTATTTGPTTSHVFSAARKYVVRLTITDSSGRTATTTLDVEVD